jgi:hypothetical protein
MQRLYDLIVAVRILLMNYEQSVTFVNEINPDELANALQTQGANPFFVLSLAIIYVRAGATRSFPQRLAELVYDAVFRKAEGTQEFLAVLNQADKKKVSRCLWGLCESASPDDLKSFLKAKNSSPLILFYWLLLAVRGEKQIVKELFQILARIAQQNMKPNAKLDYSDVIRALLDKKSYFLFHEINGVLAVVLEKGFVGNILNLFEVQWNFTFAELTLVRNFLQKRPFNSSWLIEQSYMSANCSRFLIGTVMNLAELLDASGRLTEATLLLPANFAKIGEFVHLSPNHLERIFRLNQVLFDTHVIPGKYSISFVINFFMNMHLRRNPNLFSRMLGALKTYGSKLLPEDLKSIKTALGHFDISSQNKAAIFAAFMCIDRLEPIPCLQDYIAVLKAILNRGGAHTLQVAGCVQDKLQEIVCALRSDFPDFILNALILSVDGISFLPVVTLNPASPTVIAFLQAHASSFPCKLQFLMTSTSLDQFVDQIPAVMDFIGTQVDQVGYMLHLAEMFRIFHVWFCINNITMLEFNNRISELFTIPVVLDAFVADSRFTYLTRGLRNDRRIAQMRQECEAYCAQNGTTMAEAQRSFGHVVFDCPICTDLSTLDFTTILQCGHCVCTGCSYQIENCPNCRARITHRTQANFLGISFRPDPAPQASGQTTENPEKRQRLE